MSTAPTNAARTQAAQTKTARTHVAAAAAACALLAVACAGTAPPLRLYQLRALPPLLEAGARQSSFTGTLVLGPLNMPEYLNRTTIVTRSGAAGLDLQDGHRWAEPLPEAFTRVLAQNLAARLGAGRVWTLPLPAPVQATRQLRVDVLRFDADEGGRNVVLAASWLLFDPRADGAAQAPAVHAGEWQADVRGDDVDALVAAHSAVVARMAEAIAATLAGATATAAGINRFPIRAARASG